MSFQAENRAWQWIENYPFSKPEMVLLLRLGYHSNNQSACYPTQAYLADKCQMTRPQVNNLIKALTSEQYETTVSDNNEEQRVLSRPAVITGEKRKSPKGTRRIWVILQPPAGNIVPVDPFDKVTHEITLDEAMLPDRQLKVTSQVISTDIKEVKVTLGGNDHQQHSETEPAERASEPRGGDNVYAPASPSAGSGLAGEVNRGAAPLDAPPPDSPWAGGGKESATASPAHGIESEATTPTSTALPTIDPMLEPWQDANPIPGRAARRCGCQPSLSQPTSWQTLAWAPMGGE